MRLVSVIKLRWQINFNTFSKLRMTVRTKQQLDEIRTVKSSWGKGCKGRRKASVPWV